jgi:ethanolamine utilization microcompartment shell protein EutS
MSSDAQHVVKRFVQNYVKGQQVTVVAGHDESEDCLLTLDRDLTAISLQKGRSISLSEVCQICVGFDAEEQGVDLPIDELSVAFLLNDGRDVAFRFRDIEHRDTFAICMSIFVDKLRGDSNGEDVEGPLGSDEEVHYRNSEHDANMSLSPASSDGADAKMVVKRFVRKYVKGQQVTILNVNGGVSECVVTLDRKLTLLCIQRPGGLKQRRIHLQDIEEISVGTEAEDEVDLTLDENCVTLLLEDGQAVGISFGDVEERDTFALCISIFVNSRRGEKIRKQSQGK